MATYRETQFLPQFNKNQSTSRVEAFYGPWKSIDEFLTSRPGMFAMECKDVITISVIEDGIAKEYWNPSRTSEFIQKTSPMLSKEDIWNYIEEYFDEKRCPQITSSVTSRWIIYDSEDTSTITFGIHSNDYCNEPAYVKIYTTNAARVKTTLTDGIYGISKNITLDNDPIVIGENETCLKDNILQFTIYPNIVADAVIKVEIVGKNSNRIFATLEETVKIRNYTEDFAEEYLFKPFDSSNTSAEILEQYSDYIERMNDFIDMYNNMNCYMGRGAFTKFSNTYADAYYAFNYCYNLVVNKKLSQLTSDNLDDLENKTNLFIEATQEKMAELMELWDADDARLNKLLNNVEKFDHDLTDVQRLSKQEALNQIYQDIQDLTDVLNSVIYNENPKLMMRYTFEYENHQDDIEAIEQKFEAIK